MIKDQDFYNKVMEFKGKYNEKELSKFYNYYTVKKPYTKLRGFNLSRRLATWFDPKRKEKFKEKNKEKSEQDVTLSILKSRLGTIDPLR